MFTILDVAAVAESVVQEAQSAAQDPGKSTLGMLVSLVGSIAAIAGTIRYLDEKRRQKKYKAIFADPTTASPAPLPAVDADRVAMNARITAAEKAASDALAMWRQSDAETKLRDAVAELNRTRTALVRARAVRDELKRMNGELRLDNARLQLELDNATPELVEDISGRIPTPMRPKPLPKAPL